MLEGQSKVQVNVLVMVKRNLQEISASLCNVHRCDADTAVFLLVHPNGPSEDEQPQPKHHDIILYPTAVPAKSLVVIVTPQGKHCGVLLFLCVLSLAVSWMAVNGLIKSQHRLRWSLLSECKSVRGVSESEVK